MKLEVGVLAKLGQGDGQEPRRRVDVEQAAQLDRTVGVAHRDLEGDGGTPPRLPYWIAAASDVM